MPIIKLLFFPSKPPCNPPQVLYISISVVTDGTQHLLHLKFSYNADIFPLCGPVITSCKHGPNQPTHTNTKYKFRAESCFPLSNFASSLTSCSATVNSSGADILANFTIFLNICELAKRPINESLGSLEIKNPKGESSSTRGALQLPSWLHVFGTPETRQLIWADSV